MRRQWRYGAFALVAGMTLSLLATAPPPPAPIPRPLAEGGRQSLDRRARDHVGGNGYWTKDRLRRAFRGGERAKDGSGPVVDIDDPKLSGYKLGEGKMGEGYNFAGIPQIGTFFFRTGPVSTAQVHTCSGAVVNSPSGTIVISAAHCWYGVNAQSIVFIPQFTLVHGRPQAPYGVWEMSGTKIYIDPRYGKGSGNGVAYDVAILTAAPNVANQTIQDVAGGLDMAIDSATQLSEVEIVGYPESDSSDHTYTTAYPRHCRNATTTYTEAGAKFFDIACTGMAAGISSGPWLVRDQSNSWKIVAITGGGQDGGGYTDDESVGVPMTANVSALIRKAERFEPGEGRDWSQARLMAAGDFGAVESSDDLVVTWLDGKSDLYLGSGNVKSPFMGVKRVWEDAASSLRMITTADLDGSGRDDLVTLSWDGSVHLIQDPGSGSRRRLHLNRNDPLTWVNARQIVGGDFSPDGDRKKDDLLVVWADGTTSVYLHVSKHGLSKDHRWPIGGLAGLKGSAGGKDGPLAGGVKGPITAGNFGGGSLTDVMVVGRGKDGRTRAWLITDDPPKGGLPVYRITEYDLEAAGIDPADVVATAAGNFDDKATTSDVMIGTRNAGLYALSGVSVGKTPTRGDLTTVVAPQ